MTNNKQQTAVEQFAIALYEKGFLQGNGDEVDDLLVHFKAKHKEEFVDFALFYTFGRTDMVAMRKYCEKLYDEKFNND